MRVRKHRRDSVKTDRGAISSLFAPLSGVFILTIPSILTVPLLSFILNRVKLLPPIFIIALLLFIGGTIFQSLQLTPPYPDWGSEAFYERVVSSSGNWTDDDSQAVFDNQAVTPITEEETNAILAEAQNQSQVLGITASDGSEKWVEVDLSDFKLYAWEGNRKVFEFSISTGRPGYNTPTGEFRVWRKVKSQRYKGGTPGTSGYYNLPNVPYSLFWGGGNVPNYKGYAIHGAYWHNDFGIKNRSSGCVNLRNEDAGLLYYWAGPDMPEGVHAVNTTPENPGIRVVIHQ